MTTTKKNRKTYSTEFKIEALALAERFGVSTAAKQLGIYESQLYGWRSASQKKEKMTQREIELEAQVAKLTRQLAEQTEDLAILKKAATYFAKNQK